MTSRIPKEDTFFRVQTGASTVRNCVMTTRSDPKGGRVVTLRNDTYAAAKQAAASVLRGTIKKRDSSKRD